MILSPILRLAIPILILSLASEAIEGKKACTAEGLTRACGVLEDEKIDGLTEFADGSFYPNPRELATIKLANDSGAPESNSRQKEILQQWHTYIYDYDVRNWNAGFIDSIRSEKFLAQLAQDPPPQTISVCWPPERKMNTCEVKEVSRRSIEKILKSKPTPKHQFDFESVAFYHGRSLKSAGFSKDTLFADIEKKHVQARIKKKETVNSLTEKARTNLMEVIKAGRPEQDLNVHEKAMLKKLETIRIRHGDDPEVAANPSCKGLMPNAFYDPLSHTINICDSLYGNSELNLLMTLSHEMGHSIDPCNSQSTLWMAGMGDTQRYSVLPSPLSDNFKPLTPIMPINFDKPLENYPLQKTYLCLQEKYDLVAANTNDEVKNTESLQMQSRIIKKVARVLQQKPDEKLMTVSLLHAKRDCSITTNMNEAMADWLASETIGNMLKRGELPTSRLTTSPPFFALSSCWQKEELLRREVRNNQSTEKSDPLKTSKSKDDNEIDSSKAQALSLDSHPISRDRNDLFFENPMIRKAFNCLPSPNQGLNRCYRNPMEEAKQTPPSIINEEPHQQ